MPTYLNLGSGQRKFGKPWINVDSQPTHNPDVCMEATKYLSDIWDDQPSVDIICLHHVLEHFGCGEAEELLWECHRVLRTNGSLLVFVPDMWELASMWKEGRLTDQVYFTNVYGAYMGDEADRHKWGFTKQSLCHTLIKVGFTYTISPFDFRPIEGADIARDRWILAMEAVK